MVDIAAAVPALAPAAGADTGGARLACLTGAAGVTPGATGGSRIPRPADSIGTAAAGTGPRAATGIAAQATLPATATVSAITAGIGVALALVALTPVALLAVALLGAPAQPIAGTLGGTLLRAGHGQATHQGQTRQHQGHEAAAGPGLADRAGQRIEGGGVHGSSPHGG
jgi:hypothetical protein